MKDLIWSQLEKQEFLIQAKGLAQADHELSLQFIDMLRECERRMLYAEQAYPSLWAWATQYLGLSENSAQIRISAMRLSRDLPNVRPALESGALSLTNAAQLNRFFREEKKSGKVRSSESKNKVIDQVTGLSKRECEKKLLEINPKAIPQEKERPVSAEKVELKLVLEATLLEKIKELKGLLAHTLSPDATYGELIAYMTDQQLEKIKKKKEGRKTREEVPEQTYENSLCPEKAAKPVNLGAESNEQIGLEPAPSSNDPVRLERLPRQRVYISKGIRSAVWRRAGGSCEFVSPEGVRCCSRHSLEIDHRTPLALGGLSDLTSLRLLCRAHNIQQGMKQLGSKRMAKYVSSLN